MTIAVVIYLYDGSSHIISIPHEKSATAAFYLNQVIFQLGLPEDVSNQFFSLWLKSPTFGKYK